jgi:chromosome segregation ATPase
MMAPEAFVNAVLAVLANPEAARLAANELAAIRAGQEELDRTKTSLDARANELAKREQNWQRQTAALNAERQKLERRKQSLRARLADVVAHGAGYASAKAASLSTRISPGPKAGCRAWRQKRSQQAVRRLFRRKWRPQATRRRLSNPQPSRSRPRA